MSACYPLLTDCELATIRKAAESALDTPITFTHITGHTATAGGYTETAAAPITCTARFASPTAPLLAHFANKISGQQAWVVSYSTSITTVQPGDTLTITADGSVYSVHAVLQPQSFSTLNAVLVGRLL